MDSCTEKNDLEKMMQSERKQRNFFQTSERRFIQSSQSQKGKKIQVAKNCSTHHALQEFNDPSLNKQQHKIIT